MRRTTPIARLRFGIVTLEILVRSLSPGARVGTHPTVSRAAETHPELQTASEQLADAVGVGGVTLYIWDAEVPNMFVVGTARHAEIVVSTAALSVLSEEEALATIGHELAHAKHGHALSLGALYLGVGLLTAWIATAVAKRSGRRNGVLAGAVVGALGAVVSLALTRETERAADLSGGVAIGNGEDLADALVRVHSAGEDTRTDGYEPPERGLVSRVVATHPSVKERLAYLEE